MKLPTPREGWRAFAGEVGVIVLGVLIALGAQQLVENVQTRSDVREFRRTIDHEIGLNLFVYDVRMRGIDCNEKRLTELLNWIESARVGESLPKIRPIAPVVLTPYRSAWDNRDGAVFSSVPAEARQKYAEFYDELENNWDITKIEMDQWLALQKYTLPGPLTLDDRREIHGILRRALVLNGSWGPNLTISNQIAATLRIKSIRPDNVSESSIARLKTCPAVFATEPAPKR